MSNRGDEFMEFVPKVVDHIDNYTIPQYGDAPNDNVASWTADDCMSAIAKYARRFGISNQRGEEDNLLSCLKIAHYACLTFNKYEEELRLTPPKPVELPPGIYRCKACKHVGTPQVTIGEAFNSLYCGACLSFIKIATSDEVTAVETLRAGE